MAKALKTKKERAKKYEEKVSFNGTFEDMIKISTTGAGAKKIAAKIAAKKAAKKTDKK